MTRADPTAKAIMMSMSIALKQLGNIAWPISPLNPLIQNCCVAQNSSQKVLIPVS